MVVEDFQKILSTQEELHGELVDFVFDHKFFGKILQHPFVYSIPYIPSMNAIVNKQFLFKKKRVEEAKSKKDWSSYVFMHEKPHRFPALFEIESLIENDETFWELFAGVLIDTENQWQYKTLIRILLKKDRKNRQFIMDTDEIEVFNAFPETVTVYRGCNSKNKKGFSWTTSLEKAHFFSKRFNDKNPLVLTGQVRKQDIIAYFSGRKEDEVFVLPEKVKVIKEEKLASSRK